MRCNITNQLPNLSRRLLAWRRQHPWIALGTVDAIHSTGQVLQLEFRYGAHRLWGVFNFAAEAAEIAIPAQAVGDLKWVAEWADGVVKTDQSSLSLQPFAFGLYT